MRCRRRATWAARAPRGRGLTVCQPAPDPLQPATPPAEPGRRQPRDPRIPHAEGPSKSGSAPSPAVASPRRQAVACPPRRPGTAAARRPAPTHHGEPSETGSHRADRRFDLRATRRAQAGGPIAPAELAPRSAVPALSPRPPPEKPLPAGHPGFGSPTGPGPHPPTRPPSLSRHHPAICEGRWRRNGRVVDERPREHHVGFVSPHPAAHVTRGGIDHTHGISKR